MKNSYPIVQHVVKPSSGVVPALFDAAWRSRAVSLASTGMSRRGIAARLGVSHATLFGYLERGRAEPDKEPYGSFTRDFETATRGLEEGASESIALRVQEINEKQKAVMLGRLPTDMGPSTSDFEWLLRLMKSRWPTDHGDSAHHREPELEPSGEAWLERTGMNHAQLTHMLRQPPEPVQKALVEAADDVYALLLASGWQPKEAK